MRSDRPVLVLIHGFPQDHTLWTAQTHAFTGVADVLTPDLRGFGMPVEVPTIMPMEAYASDIKDLLDAHGAKQAVLCGLSMGGYVAMAFAEAWPEMLSGLILCNTRSTTDTDEGKAGRQATAQRALDQGTAVIARAMLPNLLSARTRATRPDVVNRVERMMEGQPANGVAAASLGMASRPDRTHVLRGMRVPSLIITGSADTLMPLPTSEAMRDAIPGGRLVVIPDAAHLPNIEAPERFNAVVGDFLRSISRPHA